MFDEEQLDPRGVANLLHVLTITTKLSTFGIRGRVKCPYFSSLAITLSGYRDRSACITDVLTKF